MIKITATLQTADCLFFRSHLKALKAAIDSIDIDIVKSDFLPSTTLQMEDVLKFVELDEFDDVGFHLMVKSYYEDFKMLEESNLARKKLRLYVQQEVDTADYIKYCAPDAWVKGIGIQLDSNLKDLSFYNNFAEVQFMGVRIGFSGQKFDLMVLDKIVTLRDLGYEGIISIDGGVNLESASLIRQHAVDRVTVNSYFVKAADIKLAYDELDRALNG